MIEKLLKELYHETFEQFDDPYTCHIVANNIGWKYRDRYEELFSDNTLGHEHWIAEPTETEDFIGYTVEQHEALYPLRATLLCLFCEVEGIR